MKYISTRGASPAVSSAQAIVNGLAPDGGLYTFSPAELPKLDWQRLIALDYYHMAAEIISALLPDFTSEEMLDLVRRAYTGKFPSTEIAPTVAVGDTSVLELFRGPTSAFKDVALCLLPYLMKASAEKCGDAEKITILTATSGDTGKAALEGFRDVPGIDIAVFYPRDGVSPVQKAQMVTQEGRNVHVCAVDGNFDDAQTGVKRVFGDASVAEELEKRNICLSSANSINWGRLVPQIVYYFYAYFRLVEQGNVAWGQPVDFCVPTGNFGDILAGYYAKQMGLPVGKLVCASNKNNVLTDFIKTGTYDARRTFYKTTSPSMDILISSNLERLIYRLTGENAEKCAELMKSLSEGGEYTITEEMKAQLGDFYGNFCSEEETANTISEIYKDSNYVIDTHTAVAAGVYKKYVSETDDHLPTVIASTASPYKFTRSVMNAIDSAYDKQSDFELVDELNKLSGVKVPQAIEDIRQAEVRHDIVCDKEDMLAEVKKFLNI